MAKKSHGTNQREQLQLSKKNEGPPFFASFMWKMMRNLGILGCPTFRQSKTYYESQIGTINSEAQKLSDWGDWFKIRNVGGFCGPILPSGYLT